MRLIILFFRLINNAKSNDTGNICVGSQLFGMCLSYADGLSSTLYTLRREVPCKVEEVHGRAVDAILVDLPPHRQRHTKRNKRDWHAQSEKQPSSRTTPAGTFRAAV